MFMNSSVRSVASVVKDRAPSPLLPYFSQIARPQFGHDFRRCLPRLLDLSRRKRDRAHARMPASSIALADLR